MKQTRGGTVGAIMAIALGAFLVVTGPPLAAPAHAHQMDSSVDIDSDGDGSALSDSLPNIVIDSTNDAAHARVAGGDLVATIDGVSVTVPSDPGEPVTLETGDGSVLTMGLPASEAPISTQIDPGSGTVLHDQGDGSLTVPVIHDDGTLQVFSVIEQDDAPHSFTYSVGSTSGVILVLRADGGVLVQSSKGEELAVVAPPWAVDANGSRVPT
jgi:hypothetical protein